MSAKFTKGPWLQDDSHDGAVFVESPGKIRKTIAFVLTSQRDEESQANSALILASPLLYEALEAVDNWSNTANPMRLIQELEPVIEQCRNALRAARGEG
jgi:hypothetical protein